MSEQPTSAVSGPAGQHMAGSWWEKDPTLKYCRLQDPEYEEDSSPSSSSSSSSSSRPSPPTLNETIKDHRVTTMDLSEESLVVGMEDGHVHIVNFTTGHILKSFRPHDRAVNDVSIDNAGTTIVSCSDSGTVTLHYMGIEGEKENVVHINDPVKCVCVEDDNLPKRDRCFVVGTASGQLLYYSQVWFTKKQTILYNGDNSAVSNITWRGNIIAWADACQVRLLDIASKTAICSVPSPVGVSKVNPYPCKLFWESNTNLYIGWADSFRNLELSTQSTVTDSDNNVAVVGVKQTVHARTVADWQTDVIISGISSFDSDHILLLGYVPPDIKNYDARDNEQDKGDDDIIDQPEIQIVTKENGKPVIYNVISVNGNKPRGPWSYHLSSNYSCFNRRKNLHRWEMGKYRATRGGSRGMCPTCYVTTGEDFIVIGVRDINDRVTSALEQGDLKEAVCLGFSDRTSLRQYQLHDLMTLYIEDLLDNGKVNVAAEECNVLIGEDAILWERWILAFILRKELSSIAPYIPTKSPRLPSSVYEVVLESYLQNDTYEFLETVRKWAVIKPHIFDHDRLLLRLQATHGDADRFCLEAEAELYMLSKEYGNAIAAYLEIEGESCKSRTSKNKNNTREDKEFSRKSNFAHIFELIEREDLFDHVKDKLSNMFRLSREYTEQFLLRNLEKLTIKTVVQQLKKYDRRSLCWYLHMIFTNCFDMYNTEEYASYHKMQISLYAEETALSYTKNKMNRRGNTNDLNQQVENDNVKNGFDLITGRDTENKEEDFINFLKHSSYVPLEEALLECENRNPPLYKEMVYILARQGQSKKALGLLLREDGSAIDAIRFVESNDKDLWPMLVEYSLNHSVFLIQLLDYLGICNIDPYTLVSKIPSKLYIPSVQKKMKQIVGQYDFQVFLNDVCNDVMENDALTLLRNLNHSQRKAIKVYPQHTRCRICSRPLYLPHGPIPNDTMTLKGFQRLKSELYQIWGSNGSACGDDDLTDSEVLVFSNVASFHRFCYQEIYGEAKKQDSSDDKEMDGNLGGYDDDDSINHRDSIGGERGIDTNSLDHNGEYSDKFVTRDSYTTGKSSMNRNSFQSTGRASSIEVDGNIHKNSSSSITY